MSLWSVLFSSSEGGSTVKVRERNSDRARHTADRIEDVGDGKHTHDGYNLDTASGSYREYRGGENSLDRGYNKK